jgi:RiboL-PSP-HEPN
MAMAYGKAHRAFLGDAVPDINRLIGFHASETGAGPGRRRPDIQVVTRSAIVMTCASWEAFCEDLVAEALRHLARAKSPDDLPNEVKKTLKNGLLKVPHDLAIWSIAGSGWRTQLRERAKVIEADDGNPQKLPNAILNTPKSHLVKEFFCVNVGIDDITSAWSWTRCKPETACRKLDDFVKLRGSIAHRRAPTGGVRKKQATDALDLVQRLAGCTARSVHEFLTVTTGRGLILRKVEAG